MDEKQHPVQRWMSAIFENIIEATNKGTRPASAKDNQTSEFIAMLVEAVDRNIAREAMDEQLQSCISAINQGKKQNDEISCIVDFLRPMANSVLPLERRLAALTRDMNGNKKVIEEFAQERDLLNHRLRQSQHQLSRLMGQIYDELMDVLYSLQDGILPVFVDESGKERQSVELSQGLAIDLHTAKDCSSALLNSRKNAWGEGTKRTVVKQSQAGRPD